MKQTDIIAMISEAKDGWSYYQTDIQAAEDAYFMRLNPDTLKYLKDRNMSSIYFPKINAKSKRITDALSETYFNNDKFAKLDSYINSDAKVIEKWQEAIDHYTEVLNLYKTFQPIFQEVPYIGTSIIKVYWSVDRCRIDKMSIEDVWFDRRARTSEDVRYIVDNIYMTVGDIKKMQESGVFNKSIKVDEIFVESIPSERFKLQEVYFQDGNGWKVTTVYNDATFMRENVELKDGQPFIWGYLLPQLRAIIDTTFVCVYGEPVINCIIPLQNEMNETRNKMIDGMKHHLMPKIIMAKTAGVTRQDLETIGKPIFTANPTGTQIVPPPNLSSSQMNLQIIDSEMSETIGVSPQQNGVGANRQQTATETSIQSNEGSVRMQGYVRTFNETLFEKGFERLAMLVWKYGDARFFMGIDRSQVPSYKVTLNTGIGALNKEVQKNGLMQAHQMINQQMQMLMGLQDMEGAKRMCKASEKIVREVLPLFGIKNVDEFLGKENKDDATIANNINPQTGGVGLPSPTGGLVPQQGLPNNIQTPN